jgi:hypothetical protein
MSKAKNLANFQTTITDGTTSVATSFVTNGSVKHWVNYDAVNQTTDGSLNQSSLVDNVEGDYTSNYTSNLASARNKCIMTGTWNTVDNGSNTNSGAGRGGSNSDQAGDSVQSVSSINFHTYFLAKSTANGDFEDTNGSYCMTIGDLA